MSYQIIFYLGLSFMIITLITTIIAFFKCNVVETVSDLFGFKYRVTSSKNKPKKEKIKKEPKKKGKAKYNDTELLIQKNKEIFEKSINIPNNKSLLREEFTEFMEETDVIDESTSLLDEETSLLDEETSLLEEETGLLEEETSLLDDGFSEEFIKEFEVLIASDNYIK
ncbi:hypothetical protein [Clostridium tertium]|uniref:Uncharacterized protein n=1 Tax=Clostridium tertium TaxID=1559 RepID=A0A6N3A2P2_9CLOT